MQNACVRGEERVVYCCSVSECTPLKLPSPCLLQRPSLSPWPPLTVAKRSDRVQLAPGLLGYWAARPPVTTLTCAKEHRGGGGRSRTCHLERFAVTPRLSRLCAESLAAPWLSWGALEKEEQLRGVSQGTSKPFPLLLTRDWWVLSSSPILCFLFSPEQFDGCEWGSYCVG